MTLREFEEQCSRTLHLEIRFRNPHKICDLKPAFGLIFEKYCRGFDFWGWADIDLVFGNIRRFASDEILAKTDVFCTRRFYTTGAFSLIRNTQELRQLFMRSPDWENVFTSHRYFAFDECNHKWRYCIDHAGGIWSAKCEIVSFTQIVFEAMRMRTLRGYFEDIALETITSTVEIGPAFVAERGIEYAFFHWVIAKHGWCFEFPRWREIPHRYFVCRRGFFRPGEIGGWRQIVHMNWLGVFRHLMPKVLRSVKRYLAMIAREMGLRYISLLV